MEFHERSSCEMRNGVSHPRHVPEHRRDHMSYKWNTRNPIDLSREIPAALAFYHHYFEAWIQLELKLRFHHHLLLILESVHCYRRIRLRLLLHFHVLELCTEKGGIWWEHQERERERESWLQEGREGCERRIPLSPSVDDKIRHRIDEMVTIYTYSSVSSSFCFCVCLPTCVSISRARKEPSPNSLNEDGDDDDMSNFEVLGNKGRFSSFVCLFVCLVVIVGWFKSTRKGQVGRHW